MIPTGPPRGRPPAPQPEPHRRFYADAEEGGVYEQELMLLPGSNLSDPWRYGYATWEDAHAALQRAVATEIQRAGNDIYYAYQRHRETLEKLSYVRALPPGTLIPAPTPLDPGQRYVLVERGGMGWLEPMPSQRKHRKEKRDE